MPVQPRQRVRIGDCEVEFLRVTHSMPDCVALAIHTPSGTIVHTGDFKIDQTPIDGQHFDIHRFAELGTAGVLALFGDSTNIDRKGFTGSELEVRDAFEEVFTTATGKLLVTMFASSVYRMQILVDLADQFQRQVAFVGRGMLQSSEAAQRLGYLKLPAGRMIRDTDVESLPPSHVLCLATGSQGEPFAAMSRIAIDDHRYVKVGHDDTVVFSARAIPGNEKAIGHVMNHLARRGADVIYEGIKHVHVSGHGSEEELKLVLTLVRPRHFIPIHGEYRQLSQHARIAERVTAGITPTVKVMLIENGDILRFDADGGAVVGKAATGRVLIDASGSGEVVDEVLRDRRHLAEDGVVVPVVAINSQTGAIEGDPDVVSRGLAQDAASAELLRDAASSSPTSLRERVLKNGPIRGSSRKRSASSYGASSENARAGVRSSYRSSWRSSVAGSTLSRRVSEFFGVVLFAGRAHLADCAGDLRTDRSRVVLQRGLWCAAGELRWPRRRVSR